MKSHPAIVLVALLLIAFGLSGCASNPNPRQPVIVTERVEIPVPVKPKPLPGLMTCGWALPGFKFAPGQGNDAVLKERDQPAFREWIEQKNRCLRALQGWVKP